MSDYRWKYDWRRDYKPCPTCGALTKTEHTVEVCRGVLGNSSCGGVKIDVVGPNLPVLPPDPSRNGVNGHHS